jgi:hypothetical protein
VTWAKWPQRRQLLDALERVLASLPPRTAYYPGSIERYSAFLREHPEAHQIGSPSPGQLPWTVIRNLDPHNTDDICFTTEAFCCLIGDTALDAANPSHYLDAAVEFCNDRLWGSLVATLLAHPRSHRDRSLAAAQRRAVSGLRYGTVSVNLFSGLAFALSAASWGPYPGPPNVDIQSGCGTVANPFMLKDVEKTVFKRLSAASRNRHGLPPAGPTQPRSHAWSN